MSRNSVRKKASALGALVAIPLVVFFSFGYYQLALRKPASANEEVVSFVINQGEGAIQIASHLEKEGLINSANLFKIYLRLSHLTATLQAGEYQIPQNLNLLQLVDLLQRGTFARKVTIVEGLRREEIAEILAKELGIPEEDFLSASQGLEGKLFPETYLFERETPAKEVVAKMLATYSAKVSKGILADAEKKGLSEKELLIFASIVEREANNDKDRPLVAGILIKRWQEGWALQADATAQYALGKKGNWWARQLSLDDLATDSPFNTRKNVGLPPAPICNPSLSALKAVSAYEESPYWYYLSDADGVTHYAVTLEEHNANIAKYL